MPIGSRIENGVGTEYSAEVSKYNALYTSERLADIPDVGTKNRARFYSVLVGSTGADSGTTDMKEDGSTTALEYYVSAHADYDIHVMKILIYIVDGTVTHKGFGALGILTNGVNIIIRENGEDSYLVKDAKNFAQLIQQTLAHSAWGDGGTAFELTDVTANNHDAQVLPFDLASLIPGGLRIGRGTKDKIYVQVRDDLSDLTEFTVRLIGYRHYP